MLPFGRVVAALCRIGLLFETAPVGFDDLVFGNQQFGVGQRVCEEREEFPFLVPADEVERPLLNDVVGILRRMGQIVAVEQYLFPVVPEVCGVIFMGERLTVVTEELVEPLIGGVAFRSGGAESPFAEGSRYIACLPEHLPQRIGVGRNGVLAFHTVVAGASFVSAYGRMTRMLARHQCRA